ncbi:UDP-N-acetylmuramyl tripeptide synthase [Clostridium intestinale DSM 6191]|uniref:Lipid II isoglutaminyl synthase (glutamine-hydrolyzing) subunit MurT n=1 Tax=Clostridium intestinale DSM 6191 TaxID=1121320 RepID=A0A1M5VS96_9CLOT|nr:UDP-N-acetylmuramyl tripeptide synthase [Clostridium intestinale DSM 6191]
MYINYVKRFLKVVGKINIKSLISIIAGKTTIFLSKKLFKGGSNFPGRVSLKLNKRILKDIAKNYKVILVTGTNGKTTTTSMITNIIKNNGLSVVTNSTGANMLSGIVSCFVENYKFISKELRYAVIEVDEANVKFITEHISPDIITITNLFRDQLDRYGEVYTTLEKILEGIKKVPNSTLVLNGDESLLGRLDLPNPKVYYGFNASVNDDNKIDINADAKFCKFCKAPYSYNFITYNHLGDYYCPECDFKREELKYSVDNILELTADSSKITFNGNEVVLTQSGVYNIYNGLCAYSIAKELDLTDEKIIESLGNQSSSFGRQETLTINNKEIKIILVKNPAGYNQAIDTLCLNKDEFSAAFLLNDNYADGRDVSWIWDVHFEKLNTLNLNDIFISGIRMYDMALRLKIAGLNDEKFIVKEDYEGLTSSILASESKNIYILATYTAMINYRKYLHSKGYIEKLW